MDAYQYREKIEESLYDAINKIEGDFGYSAALLPLLLHKHDFAGLFLKANSFSLYITLINPGKEALQNEENFDFLLRVLCTPKNYFNRNFSYLDKFGKFDNSDDSGPLVIGCAKLLSEFRECKTNFFEVEKLIAKVNVDLIRDTHDKFLQNKYGVPTKERYLTASDDMHSTDLSGQYHDHLGFEQY